MTSTPANVSSSIPTDRQRRYLADLIDRANAAGHDAAALIAVHEPTRVAWPNQIIEPEPREPRTRQELSTAIGTLATLLGDAPAGRTSRRQSRARYSRRTYTRCTHEDYPCCGCER